MIRAYDPQMMSILYAPAYYAHFSHLSNSLNGKQNFDICIQSYLLLRKGKLGDLAVDWYSDDETLTKLFALWYHLPFVAHLIGCYLHREQLLKSGISLMNNPRILAFISLPLSYPIKHNYTNFDSVDFSACGLGFILCQFPELPRALKERMLLHFPVDIPYKPFTYTKTINHNNLLRMALSYANHYY